MPLTDDDRWPWLQQLAGVVATHVAGERPAVLSCSALTPAYRRVLAGGGTPGGPEPSSSSGSGGSRVGFVLLDVPADELRQRLEARAAQDAHFMPPSLLASQLATLQVEDSELLLRVAGSPFPDTPQIVARVVAALAVEAG